ncbi:MAG TPA: PEP-CTERM sorting domain-containing protein [Verrucomicrobiae bacterium]|nr:PEP-CTERM sorting domain-containing protein [Verrucomicrobiae bacterium]
MIPAIKLPLALISSAFLAVAAEAQFVAYENLDTTATAGYSEPMANNPIFGDALNMTQGGKLSTVGFSLFNSTSAGNTGSILAGTMVIKFYDNTTPYAGGLLSNLPLLGTATLNLDYSGDPLPAGFYLTDSYDISALNINVPQNIFITQQFTMTSGTSTRNGIVAFSNPTVGTSPDTFYIKSSATPEGLYGFSDNPNQFGYHIEVTIVPEPSSLSLFALAGLGAVILRRRRD